ncbi:MAG TPA: N-acetylmuramoyl-L-alanine amidase [Thermoanaerobaculia bacterium]|jgi:N-acetylmuramoyl-L-alanine amidase|nr:N-acetylmuramoyl-L-alanine amidase [Thermoanaerobaculia bacterium]
MPDKDIDRLKRQLLREVVQDNVDLAEGRLPRGLKRRPNVWLRVLMLVLLSLGLFGSTRLLPALGSPPVFARQAPAAAQPAPVPVATVAKVAKAPITAPTPVDAAVFPLAVRKIALDPGHGGDSHGTRAPLGLIEKELTLDIAQRVRKLLEADSFEVVMTREQDRSVSLEERGLAANRDGADIFVSIHLNWIENRKARGVETYYLGATNDPYLTRLAAAENRESGYSMADMRGLLDRIYADVRQENSRTLAEVIQASLFRSLGKVNPGLENRGVKAAPFIVLLSTEMPAILAEVSCLSNEDEAELLTKPLYRQYIAEALAAGIRSYADTVEGKPEEAGDKKGT